MKVKKDILPFTKAEERLIERVVQKRMQAENRFPVIMTITATFGFVSVLYGFEKMIDNVQLFVDNPSILFITGIIILAVTGSLYKKLN